jgi:spore germination cell wall hydrolase CwlJ-like protein
MVPECVLRLQKRTIRGASSRGALEDSAVYQLNGLPVVIKDRQRTDSLVDMAAELIYSDRAAFPGRGDRPVGDRLPILIAIGVDAITLLMASIWLAGGWTHAAPRRPLLANAVPHKVAPAAPNAAAPAQGPPSTLEAVPPDQAQLMNAAVPISTLPNPPAEPFRLLGASGSDRAAAVTCLTMAVYYEAGNQGDQGEAAVAQVVLNRLRNPLFPKTICGVVFEGSTLPTGCQFTFTCDGSLNRPPSKAGWKQAGQVAERAIGGYVEQSVGEATHYHTVWVVPYWQSSLIKVAQIGAHIFYRWPGPLGMPVSFRGQYTGLEEIPQTTEPDDGVRPADIPGIMSPPVAPVEVAELAKPIAPLAPPAGGAILTPSPVIPFSIDPPPHALGADSGTNPRLPMPAAW